MNWKAWLYSIFAGAIGGASNAVLGFFAMPDVFNFSHQGWINIGKLAFMGAIVPVLTFLKQSPLPSATVTVTTTRNITTTGGAVPPVPPNNPPDPEDPAKP